MNAPETAAFRRHVLEAHAGSHLPNKPTALAVNISEDVICLGSDKVDTKKLEALGIKRPHLAKREELKAALDAEPGGVPPIALQDNVKKFVDRRVMGKEFVIGPAGSEFSGIKMSPEDILKYSNAEGTCLAKILYSVV